VKQNARDMVERGRLYLGPKNQPRGERHGSAKLTWSEVKEIRRRADLGESGASLAREFRVSATTARDIIRGSIWRAEDR
jgi:hypothetical protein